MYSDDGQNPRNRRRHSRAPRPNSEMQGRSRNRRLSEDLHIQRTSLHEWQRQSLTSRKSQSSRRSKSPILSLAERIMIAKLDPDHLSMEATSSKEVQQAVASSPRPSLTDLIKVYRNINHEEVALEHSLLDRVSDAHDCLRSVASSVQSPIVGESGSVVRSASSRSRSSFRAEHSDLGQSRTSLFPKQSVLEGAEQHDRTMQSISKDMDLTYTQNPSVSNDLYKPTSQSVGGELSYTPNPLVSNNMEPDYSASCSVSKDGNHFPTSSQSESRDVQQYPTTSQSASRDVQQYPTTSQSEQYPTRNQSVFTETEQHHTRDQPAPKENEPHHTAKQSALTDVEPHHTAKQSALTDVEPHHTGNQSALTDVEPHHTGNQSALTDVEPHHTANQSALTEVEPHHTGNQSMPKDSQQNLTTNQPTPEGGEQKQPFIQPTLQGTAHTQSVHRFEAGQHRHTTDQSTLLESKQLQRVNQSATQGDGQFPVPRHSVSQTERTSLEAPHSKSDTVQQHPKDDFSGFQELQQKSKTDQSTTSTQQTDKGRQIENIAQKGNNAVHHKNDTDPNAKLSDSKIPEQDFTKENPVIINSYSGRVQPEDRVTQACEVRSTLHSPRLSVIEETPQKGDFLQPLTVSQNLNGNSNLAATSPALAQTDEVQTGKQRENPGHSKTTEQMLAEKRTAYLQKHSKTTNQKMQAQAKETEKQVQPLQQAKPYNIHAENPNDHTTTTRKAGVEYTQLGPSAKLEQSNRHHTDRNDMRLKAGTSHRVSLPAIHSTMTPDAAGNVEPCIDSAAPFSLPSIPEATNHPDSKVNTAGRKKDDDDDECSVIPPSLIQETVHFPGSKNSGNDDINLPQLQGLQPVNVADNSRTDAYGPHQKNTHGQQFMLPRISAHQTNIDTSKSHRENTLAPDLSRPDPAMTSRDHPPLESNNTQKETGSSAQGKGDTRRQPPGKSINIFIGDTTPHSFLSDTALKADKIRLPVIVDIDPHSPAMVSGQRHAPKHKDTKEEQADFLKFGDQISIEINSEGEVSISAYSSQNILSERGKAHEKKTTFSGKPVSERRQTVKENRSRKDTVPPQAKKNQRYTTLKLSDKVHIHAQTDQQKRASNFYHATAPKGTNNGSKRIVQNETFNRNANASTKSNSFHRHHNSNRRERTNHNDRNSSFSNFSQSGNNRKRNPARALHSCCKSSQTYSSITRVHFDTESKETSSTDSDNDDDDDDDDDAHDDRIYDFIGLSRSKSYTLPEIMTRKSTPPGGIDRRGNRLDSNNTSSKVLDFRIKPFLPEMSHQHQNQPFGKPSLTNRSALTPTDGQAKNDKHFKFPALRDDIASGQLRWQAGGRGVGRWGSADDQVKLPQLTRRKTLVDQVSPDLKDIVDRQHRVLGLYEELKHINVHSTRPSSLRLNLAQRHSSDLDVRIEWGRRLSPDHNHHHTLKRRSKLHKKTSKTRSLDFEEKHLRRSYSENFLFMDDDVFPQLKLRHQWEGLYPDVRWFLRPGVASENCDVGFVDGRLRDRRTRAWMMLKSKCMSRVHIMKSLETNTFARIPKLKLN